uniref:Uncharacterized protein n=1 Tax=Ixodes ricinus TaxID=34613 RepID=A0A6B0UNF8_IXORI
MHLTGALAAEHVATVPAVVLAAPDPELCPAGSAVGGGVVRHPEGGPGLPLVHLLPAELRGAATVLAPAPRGLPAAGTVQPKSVLECLRGLLAVVVQGSLIQCKPGPAQLVFQVLYLGLMV